jgi:hypothetical protein
MSAEYALLRRGLGMTAHLSLPQVSIRPSEDVEKASLVVSLHPLSPRRYNRIVEGSLLILGAQYDFRVAPQDSPTP